MKISLLVLLAILGAVTCQVGDIVSIDAADIRLNENIQQLANFGAQNVARQAIQAGDIPDGAYTISRVYNVSQQQVPNGFNHYFDVEISNELGDSTRATYTVNDNTDDNDQDVTAYTYQRGPGLDNVVFGTGDLSDEVDFSDSLALLGPDVVIADEESNLEWLGEAWIGEDDLVTEDGIAGAYSPVSVSDFNNDQQAQDLLESGLGDVINQLVNRGELDDNNPFELTQVYSVSQQVVNGLNYRYDVGIDNRQGTTGRVVLVVYSQPWTETEEVTSYNYTINTVTAGSPITYGGTSQSQPDADWDETDDDVPDGYNSVDLVLAANDPQIQSAQNVGAQFVAEQGINTGVLPDGQYSVSQVFDVSQLEDDGANYRFDAELSNGQGRQVRAQYYVYLPQGGTVATVTSFRFRS